MDRIIKTMKKLLLLFLFILFFLNSFSQTDLKWNAAYWAVGITNMSVETKIANKWTFNSDLIYSPWKSIEGNHFEFAQIIPEIRFYTKKAFDGVYCGIYGSFQLFNITKWNYWNKGRHQIGNGFAFGITIGYKYQINPQLGLDSYIGAGRQASHYRGYTTSTGEQYVGWNGSGEWLPYKIGIAISYRL